MFCEIEKIKESLKYFSGNEPFNHCLVDGFLREEVAHKLEAEFPSYDDVNWHYYKNAIEDKKALNDWNQFPPLTYKLFRELISEQFISLLSDAMGISLYADPGLHGGGWHMHAPGGNLNPHLDYSMHPKVGLQRKINIIIYLSSSLHDEHGGHLGLWSHDSDSNAPGNLVKEIQPKFNRAVIFDNYTHRLH